MKNQPGASIDDVVNTTCIKGRRFFRGSWNREPVDRERLKKDWPQYATDAKLDELAAKYPARGEANVQVDRMIGLWVPYCEGGLVERCTIALNADEALLVGPPDATAGMARFGRTQKLLVYHNLIGHGLHREGHPDDLDREIRGLESHGHATAVLLSAGSYNTQLYKNAIIGQANRALIYMGVANGDVTAEAINNVCIGPTQHVINFYDKGLPLPAGSKSRANIIGNLIVDGPDRTLEKYLNGKWPYNHPPFYIGTSGKVYMAGNKILLRDGKLVEVEPLLSDDERDAMPDSPVGMGTPKVEIAEAGPGLLYDLLGGYGIEPKIGAGGEFDDWCLEQARIGQARPLKNIDQLPEHLLEYVKK